MEDRDRDRGRPGHRGDRDRDRDLDRGDRFDFSGEDDDRRRPKPTIFRPVSQHPFFQNTVKPIHKKSQRKKMYTFPHKI